MSKLSMMKHAALVLLVACDRGAKPVPAAGSAAPPVSVARSVDAAIADAPPPCSAADLDVTGEQKEPRIVDIAACTPRTERIYDTIIDGLAASAMLGNVKRIGAHVIADRNNPSVSAIEVTSVAQLAGLMSCRRGLPVDWKSDHAWLLTFRDEDPSLHVASVIDDGHYVALGLGVGEGAAAPHEGDVYTVVLIPKDRDVMMADCTRPRRH